MSINRASQAFNATYFIEMLKAAGVDPPFDEGDAFQAYLHDAALRIYSPNPLVNELWYRMQYPDVRAAVEAGSFASGYGHYVNFGIEESRQPNPTFWQRAQQCSPERPVEPYQIDGKAYRLSVPESSVISAAFPWLEDVDVFNKIGRLIGHRLHEISGMNTLIASKFDPDFYRKQYGLGDISKEAALEHYLREGVRQKRSPSSEFDEAWYLAIYKDVRTAVQRGEYNSGFHHFLTAGRLRGRLPKPDSAGALEYAIKGVTAPRLLQAIPKLAERVAPAIPIVEETGERTFWMIAPRLNPDISFGGYKALYELSKRLKPYLRERGVELGFLLTEEPENTEYFLYRNGYRADFTAMFEGTKVVALAEDQIRIGPKDRFMSYSVNDAWIARTYAEETDERRFFALVQEYEATFHPHCSVHAIADAAFRLDSYPIFNSRALRDYFARHRLGVFARLPDAKVDRDYAFFEHVPTKLPLQSIESMSNRTDKWVVVYARPEAHAMRNLFEVVVLGLRKACSEGVFDASWNFLGLGALSELPPVDLGGGHLLRLQTKLPEEEYARLIDRMDIGLSLMYAPHPSVIPFEFAATGASVVTNRFDGRDDAFFAAKSKNIIPCDASVDGVAEALAVAAARQPHTELRHAQALCLADVSWDSTFDAAFFDKHFEWAIGAKRDSLALETA